MAISAKEVSELRAKTGVGMMDCKKALEEAGGNFEEAMKSLKERGLVVAAKKAERVAAEGLVDILYDEASGTAAMVEVNSETDFVAKNEKFRAFARGCLDVILEQKPADVGELLSMPFDGGMTVDEALKDKILQLGENMSIRRFVATTGVLSTYIHNKGAIGVIVKVEADEAALSGEGFAEFKKNLALQIASMKPLYVERGAVPASVIAEEKERIAEQIKEDEANAKKPPAVIEKMIEGKIRKYYEDNCLLEQGYVKAEDKMLVGEYIANYAKQTGGQVKVAEFHKFEKGEGIQKREDDFAGEIAKLTAGR
ncbi:MAG: translation elongation factor Ts [Oscillospiraceae bacterium]|nr:translation elongation factor Ts [Oscillospiraceae bacterium]